MWETKAKNNTKYLCSIYESRPEPCVKYPWNHANQIFPECIFYDAEDDKLRTNEEQLKLNTEQEISDYCVSCGRCCYFGPAKCSMLRVVQIGGELPTVPEVRVDEWLNAVSETFDESKENQGDNDEIDTSNK